MTALEVLSADQRARVSAAQEEFEAEVAYLNTASLGLPPRRGLLAVQEAQQRWRRGRAAPTDYDAPLAAARVSYASLVGVDPGCVAVGSQTSAMVGLVAASVRDGARVLAAEGEFTSVTFPFLAQAGRGVTVRTVPLERVVEELAAPPEPIDLVAVSAVQSADGRVLDLDALAAAADAAGTPVLLDTTQATGWLPIDAGRFACTVGGGYKWLLAPRGTCFATLQPDLLERVVPHAAGWFAGEDPWQSLYVGPMRLARTARRLDVSPAWHAWVGQAPALELLTEVGVEALHAHATGLARRFCTALGIPDAGSAIVSVAADASAAERLERAEVACASRAGRLRFSFHLSTSDADVDRALEALDGLVHQPPVGA